MSKIRAILIGNGGHARVLREVAELNSITIAGVVDNNTQSNDPKYLGTDTNFQAISANYKDHLLINGIGSTKDTSLRKEVFLKYKKDGFSFATLIHPRAIISKSAIIEEGSQIMAAVVLQAGCHIKTNTIINTSTSIDHDCNIGSHCHIAPGCVLSGGVNIGDTCHIGTGSIFIQSLSVGDNSFVAAGSVVVKDVPGNQEVRGDTAKQKDKK